MRRDSTSPTARSVSFIVYIRSSMYTTCDENKHVHQHQQFSRVNCAMHTNTRNFNLISSHNTVSQPARDPISMQFNSINNDRDTNNRVVLSVPDVEQPVICSRGRFSTVISLISRCCFFEFHVTRRWWFNKLNKSVRANEFGRRSRNGDEFVRWVV